MYSINNKKYFETLTEAKLELISLLSATPMDEEAAKVVELTQISIEQHHDKHNFLSMLKQNLSCSNGLIEEIMETIERSPLIILPVAEKNTHATLGAIDSFLPAQLLLNPTKKMLEAINKVSKSIVLTFKYYLKEKFPSKDEFTLEERNTKEKDNFKAQIYIEYFGDFSKNMIFETHTTYPGLFSLEEINSTLEENEKIVFIYKKLTELQIKQIIEKTVQRLESKETPSYQVMAIHTQFCCHILKKIPLKIDENDNYPPDNPVYAKIVTAYNNLRRPNDRLKPISDMREFRTMLRDHDIIYNKVREFTSDIMMYQCALFTLEQSRGRGIPDKKNLTTTLGVMRNNEAGMRQLLPNFENTPAWIDWSKCHFYPESKIVQSMTHHETPFISSYSGTTSLLLNLMISGYPMTLEEQQSYLCSIMAYVSGCGYHSIHEILGVAVYCTDIFPRKSYPIEMPRKSSDFRAPQYYNFYKRLMDIDPEFGKERKASWTKLNHWYNSVYKVHHKSIQINTLIDYLSKIDFDPRDSVNLELRDFINELAHASINYECKKKLFEFINQNPIRSQFFLQKNQINSVIIFYKKFKKIFQLKEICNKFELYLQKKKIKENKKNNSLHNILNVVIDLKNQLHSVNNATDNLLNFMEKLEKK